MKAAFLSRDQQIIASESDQDHHYLSRTIKSETKLKSVIFDAQYLSPLNCPQSLIAAGETGSTNSMQFMGRILDKQQTFCGGT